MSSKSRKCYIRSRGEENVSFKDERRRKKRHDMNGWGKKEKRNGTRTQGNR
jgi:hypothetical protein